MDITEEGTGYTAVSFSDDEEQYKSSENFVFNEMQEESGSSSYIPDVPASPSSKINNSANNSSRHFEKLNTPLLNYEKKEFHRKPNSEYISPLIANIWYCFYFQYVCKCSPVQDEDIYDVNPDNKTSKVTEEGERRWEKVYSKYKRELEEYNNKKKLNPKFFFYKF